MAQPLIVIVPYQSVWPQEFRQLGGILWNGLQTLALRIDHIGSTAVPGLAAKDRIDIQVTVAALSPDVDAALNRIGYRNLKDFVSDHVPPGYPADPQQWAKWVYEPPAGQRPTNLHVRVEGRANQRYPLLFRDYLRAHPAAAEAYAQVKIALAARHPNDKDAYYAVKDPVCDILMAAAEAWATQTGWRPPPSDA